MENVTSNKARNEGTDSWREGEGLLVGLWSVLVRLAAAWNFHLFFYK